MMNETGSVMKTSLSDLDKTVKIIEKQEEAASVVKVAAYCRVSKDVESQQQSLATQMEAYERVIKGHPGWVLAGIYTDKGISGTSVKNRKAFLQMIEDAKAGKIQYILAKSISRFARNTVDVLAYIRELKSYGVSVFFEKEKIDTGNTISEFVLSIYAASAQEEIISLSNNMKMGRRMRYSEGIVPWTHIYGLRCAEDGSWVIEENEARIVRRIFNEYIEGKSVQEIQRGLDSEGIPSIGGQANWSQTTINLMLKNEKYAGDLRMQKTYVVDPITQVKVKNRDGKLKQYYKENHHPGIVSKEVYHMATMISAMQDHHNGVLSYPYYGFLKCPICGANMVRFHVPRDACTYAWTCSGQATDKGTTRKDRSSCPPYFFIEKYILQALWEAVAMLDIGQLTDITKNRNQEKACAAESLLRLKEIPLEQKAHLRYKDLYETVDTISFPQWTVMKVNWKYGMKSTVQIDYEKVSDFPYLEIQVIRNPMKKSNNVEYLVNGKPMNCFRPDVQVKTIQTTRNEVLDLMIIEPKEYEAKVLKVYDSRCRRRKERKESRRAVHEPTDC